MFELGNIATNGSLQVLLSCHYGTKMSQITYFTDIYFYFLGGFTGIFSNVYLYIIINFKVLFRLILMFVKYFHYLLDYFYFFKANPTTFTLTGN